MDAHGWIALATLVAATVLFVTEWVSITVTALSIPVVLCATGVIDAGDALSGFGNHAVISIAATFAVGAGLKESGVATLVARGLQGVGGRSERRLLVLLMTATACVSAFMSNAATVAMLLPVAASLSRRALIAPSRLYMPLAIAALLGGTVTLLGTQPNFLVADYIRHRAQTLEVFDFAWIGIPIVATGILFVTFAGRRLLPERTTEDRLREAKLPEDVARSYGLEQNLFLMRLVPASHVAGKTIAQSDVRRRYGLGIVMVRRQGPLGGRHLEPRPETVLLPGDLLYVEGDDEAAWRFAEEELLQFGLAGPTTIEKILGRGIVLAECTLSPHGEAVGRTFKQLDFRKRYGCTVISLWRREARTTEGLADIPLEVGDAFLVSGPTERIRLLAQDPDFIVLSDVSQAEDLGRAPLAILWLLVAVVPPIVGWLPVAASALAAAILMAVSRCVSRVALQRAMDVKVLSLMIGTIPLGTAMDQRGVAAAIAGLLAPLGEGLGVPGVLGTLFVLSAVLSILSSNAAAAVIVAPIAAKAAVTAGIGLPHAMLAVAYGASCAFVLPFSQTNILVMAPGGYQARDFFRVGLPVSIVMAVTAIVGLSLT
jgi:di/tricarboxylate transporter